MNFSTYVKVCGVVITTALFSIPTLSAADCVPPYHFPEESIRYTDALYPSYDASSVSVLPQKRKEQSEMPICGRIKVKITNKRKMMEWN